LLVVSPTIEVARPRDRSVGKAKTSAPASGIPPAHLPRLYEHIQMHNAHQDTAIRHFKVRTCCAFLQYTNRNINHRSRHHGRQTRPIPEQSGRFRLRHAHQLLQGRRQLHPRRREQRGMGVALSHLEMGSHGMQHALKFPVLNLKFVDGLRLAQVQLLQSHRPWRNPNISAFCAI
jgi:hypothetical protein